jgi:predicted ATPase
LRTATFAQAEAFRAEVVSAYQRLGCELIEIPPTAVEERAAFVAAHLPSGPKAGR